MPDYPSLNEGESNAELSLIKWKGNPPESSNHYVLNP